MADGVTINGNKYRVLVTEIGTGRVVIENECKLVQGSTLDAEGECATFFATQDVNNIERLSVATSHCLDVIDRLSGGDKALRKMLIGLAISAMEKEKERTDDDTD